MRKFLTLALLLLLAVTVRASTEWLDITLAVVPGQTPTYPGDPPIDFKFTLSLDRGDPATVSQLNFGAHTGTHIDAPSHFIKGGKNVDQLPLEALMGQAYVIECKPEVRVIDALELRNHYWRGARRILFKTRNSHDNLWNDSNFHKDFTYIAPDAARQMAEAGVELVGIDYLSVEKFAAPAPQTHRILLEKGIVIVEGLDLRQVESGLYDLICLPARFSGREAAPARALLRPLKL